jgi:hypothetical protein
MKPRENFGVDSVIKVSVKGGVAKPIPSSPQVVKK